MKSVYQPIQSQSLADQVFEQLRDHIFRGQLQPGERVLPERDLAMELGVSRTTVRNAIAKLVTMGFLEHRQGQGTFVGSPETLQRGNPFSQLMTHNGASLDALLEVRIGLECHAAVLAAQRADENDIRLLDANYNEMNRRRQTGGLATDADVAFHMSIAYATHNSVHVDLMKRFYDYLFHSIRESLALLYQEPDHLENVQRQHGQILAAIKSGAPERARSAMHRHIDFLRDFLRARQNVVAALTQPSPER